MKEKIKKSQVKNIYNKSHDEIENAFDNFQNNKIKLGEYFFKLKKEVGHGNFISIIENDYPFINIRNVQLYISAYKKEEA